MNDSTKLKFAEAMRTCMTSSNVETITVTEICQTGNLSRQSFYRCFKDKYDLINWYFDRILKESFRQMGYGHTIRESLLLKFQYIEKEAVFFHAAFSTDTQNNLRDHDFEMIFSFYKNRIHEQSGKEIPADILHLLEMYCIASVYMTVKWVLHHNPSSKEQLADILIDGIPPKLAMTFQQCGLL